jgi:hypothetical protein
VEPGLPDGLFSNPKFGKIFVGFEMEIVGIFNVPLVFLRPFGIFYGHLVYFRFVWYIFSILVYFLHIFGMFTKKNLATLRGTGRTRALIH